MKNNNPNIKLQKMNKKLHNNKDNLPKATHQASLIGILGVDVDCYVLDKKDIDGKRLRILGLRGMADAIGLTSKGGNVFLRTINSKGLSKYIGSTLREKLTQPIIFKVINGGSASGYEATVLTQVCRAILDANTNGALAINQQNLVTQAQIIVGATSDFGILNLVDNLTGFNDTKEQYIEHFKKFLRDEIANYEKQFPREFYDACYKIYNIEQQKGKNHPQFFAHITTKYIYEPLAKSNGLILKNLDIKNPMIKAKDGTSKYRKHKFHQFLETIGIIALKEQIATFIAIAKITNSKEEFIEKYSIAIGTPITPDMFEYK